MRRLISERFALNTMLAIFSLVVVFHLLIITGIIPFSIVWGGRLKAQKEMIRFETISITANLVMLLVVLIRSGRMKIVVPALLLSVAFGLMAGLFFLNTLGNLLSTSTLEKVLFTPLTFLLFLCSVRLALSNRQATGSKGDNIAIDNF